MHAMFQLAIWFMLEGGVLLAVPFDLDGLAVTGSPKES